MEYVGSLYYFYNFFVNLILLKIFFKWRVGMIVKITYIPNILHVLVYFILINLWDKCTYYSCKLHNNSLHCWICVSFYYYDHFYFEGYLDLKKMNIFQGMSEPPKLYAKCSIPICLLWKECPKCSSCHQVFMADGCLHNMFLGDLISIPLDLIFQFSNINSM